MIGELVQINTLTGGTKRGKVISIKRHKDLHVHVIEIKENEGTITLVPVSAIESIAIMEK